MDLQRLLEAAWREGFDPDGARHFRGKLAGKNGESAMIGAGEWVALLWHLRVEAFVVEVVDRRGAGTAVYRVASACFAQPAASVSAGGVSPTNAIARLSVPWTSAK